MVVACNYPSGAELCCTSVVPRVEKKDAFQTLDHVQAVILRGTIRLRTSTPTAALRVTLGVSPLDIEIMGVAARAAYRLKAVVSGGEAPLFMGKIKIKINRKASCMVRFSIFPRIEKVGSIALKVDSSLEY